MGLDVAAIVTLQFTIQLVNDAAVSPCYLRLKSTNDGDYKMETSCGGLPDPEVNGLDPKCKYAMSCN